jgi:hypothetical protein
MADIFNQTGTVFYTSDPVNITGSSVWLTSPVLDKMCRIKLIVAVPSSATALESHSLRVQIIRNGSGWQDIFPNNGLQIYPGINLNVFSGDHPLYLGDTGNDQIRIGTFNASNAGIVPTLTIEEL